MPFPFGEHPTLNSYLRWAEKSGCTVKSGVTTDPSGRPSSVVLVESPEGSHLIIADMLESERLAPSTVAYFDRRLGMSSGFPSLDGTPDGQ